jgi:hypothetical protein
VRQLRSEYGAGLALAAALVALGLIVAAVIVYRRRDDRAQAIAAIARIFAIGAVGLILASTAVTVGRPFGGGFGGPFGRSFVAGPGVDAFRAWGSELAEFPRTVSSILLVGNLGLYLFVGFAGVIGWGRRAMVRIFIACVVLALYVAFTRITFLGGVAVTDDVLMNGLAALLGVVAGGAVDRAVRPGTTEPITLGDDARRAGGSEPPA